MEIMTDFDDSFKIASHDFEFESCNEQECETSCDSSRLLNPDGSALDGFSVDNVVIGSFLRFLGPTLNSVRLRYKTPRDRNTPTYDEISQEYVFTYLLRRSCLNHKGQTCRKCCVYILTFAYCAKVGFCLHRARRGSPQNSSKCLKGPVAHGIRGCHWISQTTITNT